MERISVWIGGKNPSAMRSIEDKMTGWLLNDTAAGGDKIAAIGKIRRKGEVARATQNRKINSHGKIFTLLIVPFALLPYLAASQHHKLRAR